MKRNQVAEAIAAHDAWRQMLAAAIRTGSFADGLGRPLDVAGVSNDEACRLGKWLKGTSASQLKQFPDYRDVLALNQAFHKQAGRVLGMALAGKLDQAEQEMARGSILSKLSTTLVVKLSGWMPEQAREAA